MTVAGPGGTIPSLSFLRGLKSERRTVETMMKGEHGWILRWNLKAQDGSVWIGRYATLYRFRTLPGMAHIRLNDGFYEVRMPRVRYRNCDALALSDQTYVPAHTVRLYWSLERSASSLTEQTDFWRAAWP